MQTRTRKHQQARSLVKDKQGEKNTSNANMNICYTNIRGLGVNENRIDLKKVIATRYVNMQENHQIDRNS